jgi:hypothetical protein
MEGIRQGGLEVYDHRCDRCIYRCHKCSEYIHSSNSIQYFKHSLSLHCPIQRREHSSCLLYTHQSTQVIIGPLSFLTAHSILVSSPYRHLLQILVSACQLYGNWIYYPTSLFDSYFRGVEYSRPEATYFWGYFVGMNFALGFWTDV